MKKMLLLGALMLAAGALFAQGGAEEKYPSKDIQFIVSSGAGGGTDTIVRKITSMVEKDLGTTFFVVNKPGASDSIGPNAIMSSKPDGYTIGNLTYGSAIQGVYNQVVKGYSMDKLRFISMVTEESDAFMVSKNAPFRTFEEFIAYAKAHPGEVTVADQGIGSRVYLVVRGIENKYGVEFKKLSYSSSAPQREAMLNGEVQVACTSLGDFAPLLKSGDCFGMVEFSENGNLAYPDVPSAKALGMGPESYSSSFLCIAAPAGIADAQAAVLEAAFKKNVESKEFVDWTVTIGVTAHYMSGADTAAFIKDLQDRSFPQLDELKKQGLI